MVTMPDITEATTDAERLTALRDQLARLLVDAKPSEAAALAKQYRDTIAAINGADAEAEDDPIEALEATGTVPAPIPLRSRGRGKRG